LDPGRRQARIPGGHSPAIPATLVTDGPLAKAGRSPAVPATGRPHGLAERVQATVGLLAGRGYAVTPERLGRLLYGGPADAADVLRAVEGQAWASVVEGRVAAAGADVAASVRRQDAHEAAAAHAWEVAEGYVRALARHCPWLRAAWVAGSLASGGFEEGDDIDFNLVVADGTKYLSYLCALAVGLPPTWRERHRAGGHRHGTPLLPKLVCINVVWEQRQTRPFVRDDPGMALELLLGRPLHGRDEVARIVAANPALAAHFPQLQDQGGPAQEPVRPSLVGRLLALATRPAWMRRALDRCCYGLVRGLHAWVRWHRRRRPGLRSHVEEMERHKRPYGILDRPGREGA
jgi:hypothetical protein